ncbi:MAG TPA: hypothetical protein VIK61_07120 [Acidimicrobiia bacterium]
MDHPAGVQESVRRRYAELAETAAQGSSCCAPGEEASFGASVYDDQALGAVPELAAKASLGCGNPTAVADLREGEVVLDLGSGGGIDVILSARRVGPLRAELRRFETGLRRVRKPLASGDAATELGEMFDISTARETLTRTAAEFEAALAHLDSRSFDYKKPRA